MLTTLRASAALSLVFGSLFFAMPSQATPCVSSQESQTIAATEAPVSGGVRTIETCGGDDISYQVPLTTTVTFDGQTFAAVYATTNSVITFGRPDGTYWTYPSTPSISLYSMDWVVYPNARADEHLTISSSDGGFQVDISARPIFLQSAPEATNINIVAAINADGTVAISYALTGPDYAGYNWLRTGVRLTNGDIVTLEEYGIVQVEEAPVLTPEPIVPEQTSTPEPTPTVTPTPTPVVPEPVMPTPVEPIPTPVEPAPVVPIPVAPVTETVRPVEPITPEPIQTPEPSPQPSPTPTTSPVEPAPPMPQPETPSAPPVEPPAPENTAPPVPEAPPSVPPVAPEPTPIKEPAVEPPAILYEEKPTPAPASREEPAQVATPDEPQPVPQSESSVVQQAIAELAVAAQEDDPSVPEELAAIPVLGAASEAVLEAFNALGNVGADMRPEVREKAEDVVVAAVIAGQIATVSIGSASIRRIK